MEPELPGTWPMRVWWFLLVIAVTSWGITLVYPACTPGAGPEPRALMSPVLGFCGVVGIGLAFWVFRYNRDRWVRFVFMLLVSLVALYFGWVSLNFYIDGVCVSGNPL